MTLKNIESVYPLSPMQESMLFYAQSRITAKKAGLHSQQLTHDVLFNQTNIDIGGVIHVTEFKQAWQQLASNNSAFRTGFLWEGLKQAQQFVRKEIELPFEFIDLAEQSEQAGLQHQALEEILLRDIQQGFDLQQAPLMRVTLVRLSINAYRLIWSCHHLVIDRWCIPIVFELLTKYYDALMQKESLPTTKAPPYKRYIAWHHKLSAEKSEHYWANNLADYSHTSQVCERMRSAPQAKYDYVIGAPLMQQVKQFCRAHKITLPSLFQSVWSLSLNQCIGLQDIVYGLVVSGRPSQISDVENIIGTFVNNVPVRQTMPHDAKALQWLKQNQYQSFQRIEHEHESVIKLHGYTQLEADAPLFDHVLVWQNATGLSKSNYFSMTPVAGNLRTAYPLTVSIEETSQGLQLAAVVSAGWQFIYKDTLLNTFERILLQLISLNAEQTLQAVEGFVHSNTFTASQKPHNKPIKLVIDSDSTAGSDEVMKGRTGLNREVVEEFLTREWKSILELDNIDLDDDFFALGGTSLQAAQLVARVEQAEKKQIPIIQLFSGRTIRSMAEIYLHADWSIKPGWIIPVNTKGTSKPVFYIASPEVNVIGYAQLARELGSDISGYIVQPPPQSEHVRQVRTKDIPALSLQYIAEIQKIQKSGPYHIVGMCSGAHISGEMMRQMQNQSLEVGYYGVINTWSLYSISPLYHAEKIVDFYRMLRYYAPRMLRLNWSEVTNRFLPALRRKLITNKPASAAPLKASEVAQQHLDNSGATGNTTGPKRQYDETVVPVKEEKWASERPSDFTIIKQPITVFRIKHRPYWRIKSEQLGWNYLAEQVKVVYLRETVHEAILRDPHVAHFAGQLREELLHVKGFK